MGRIIKQGREWKYRKESWYGTIVECKDCGCQFELDQTTNFRVYTGGLWPGISYILCPECQCTTGVKVIR